jgi:branched-chain amino acid transport system ATP-binding protein
LAPEADNGGALLVAEGLTKSYASLRVIDQLGLRVARGEALGIIGPNGAGKTTLFNLVDGSLPVDGGRIFFDGQEVTHEPCHRRCRRGVARTFQVPRPFVQMSVYENVLVGAVFAARCDDPEERAAQALSRAGLFGSRDRLAGTLTLLERKRLELARAMATSPKALLLDEVAGGLTDAELAEFLHLLEGVRREGVTVVWIEHAVTALASFVDRLLAINFGTKVAEGTPREVLGDPAVRQIYLGVEA